METQELIHVIVTMLILFVISSVSVIFRSDLTLLPPILLFSILIILVHVFSKKLIAYYLDSSVHHRIWEFQQFGFQDSWKFDKPVPFGLIVPLIVSFFTLGFGKVMTLLTYETSALKYRAAKRHGFYSYTEMTDWHNGLIGAFSIVCLILLSFIAYFPGLETLSKMAAYYAFWNMIPISKLDGTQIFFGSKIIWSVLAIVTAIFTAYALLLAF